MWVDKTLSGYPGHMRQNAYFRYLKWTYEDLLPVLLLRNKEQEYSNLLASLQPAS